MALRERLISAIPEPRTDVHICCQEAKHLEDEGKYEQAAERLGAFWGGLGERPNVSGLHGRDRAEVVLRAGVLTGWIGSVKAIGGLQEVAKDLITESLLVFESLQDSCGIGEAKNDLALCYWREGAFDEARVLLHEAAKAIPENDLNLRVRNRLRLGIVERGAKRYKDALHVLTESAPVFEAHNNHSLLGGLHNELAIVLNNLAAIENNQEYTDRAILEYTAASYHKGLAGNIRFSANVENNLAWLLVRVGRLTEAHDRLDIALKLSHSLGDTRLSAQFDDTRARVLIAQKRYREAERVAGRAVKVLVKSGESSVCAEALITQAVALARSGQAVKAQEALDKAIAIACQVGDHDSAGRAWLTVIEELLEYLSLKGQISAYNCAEELLRNSQDYGVIARLKKCVGIILESAFNMEERELFSWEGFSLLKERHAFEERYITRALRDAKGELSAAAKLLGVSPQHLDSKLKNSFKNLRLLQTNKRKTSIIQSRKSGAKGSTWIRMHDDSLSNLGVSKGEELEVRLCKDVNEGDLVAVSYKSDIYVGYYHKKNGWIVLEPGDNNYIADRCEEKYTDIIGQVVLPKRGLHVV